VRELWCSRGHLGARIVLALMSAGTGVWAFVLADRTPDWLPVLRWIVLAGSVVLALMLVVGAHRRGRSVAVLAAAAILFAAVAPAAYAVETVATAHNGPISTSGPSKGNALGDPGPGGHGGPGGRITENAALAEMVQGLDNRWAVAAIGSMGASGLELKTGASIMAIGGFTGSDDSPTLEQFQGYVAGHEVRYFIAGEPFGPPGRHESGAASEITSWVKKNFKPIQVGETTVYDLSAPVS
jgi:4-amino-4-deoxy-L-arabinose transferase-like glycosyltransferase